MAKTIRILAVDVGTGTQDILLFESGRDHALAGFAVAVTPQAARTFDDDLAMVEQMGFEIITDAEAELRKEIPNIVHIELQDFDATAIIGALSSFDVDPGIDAMAIAAFDHGAAPPGVSDRRFRFDFIAQTVKQNPVPSAFAYPAQKTPADLTRLRSISVTAERYLKLSDSDPQSPLLLMDTGSAAVL